jgi:hypothetical protein
MCVYTVVVGELLDITALSELEAQAFRYTRINSHKHGGVSLSNLTRIKTTSIPAIMERVCDTSHLKVGLLNVGSLTSKAVSQ